MDHINSSVSTRDFKPQDRVKYIPSIQADEFIVSDNKDEIGEHGVVKSTNQRFVFVNYIRNGILQHTAQATDPRDLIK